VKTTAVLLILVTLAAAPLAYGAVEVWASSVIELAAAVLLTAAVAAAVARPRQALNRLAPFAPLAVLIALPLAQLIPLSRPALATLSPHADQLYKGFLPDYRRSSDGASEHAAAPDSSLEQSERRTLSLYPHATWYHWRRLAAYVIFGCAVALLFTRAHVVGLCWTLAVAGFALALFGLVQDFAWEGSPQKIYWLRHITHAGGVFGPFVNANHCANYLCMTTLASLGLLVGLAGSFPGAEVHRTRVHIPGVSDRHTCVCVCLGLAVVVMTVAILFTLSRGAVISLAAGLITFVLLLAGGTRARRRTALIILVLCSAVIFMAVLGAGAFADKMRSLWNDVVAPQQTARTKLWSETLHIAADFPLTGTGLGTFQHIHPAYKSVQSDMVFLAAENEYVQVLSELGPLGFAAMICFGVGIIAIGRRRVREASGSAFAAVPAGLTAALVATVVHSCFDFPFQVPSNGLLFFAVAGTLIALQRHGNQGRKSAAVMQLA